MRPVSPAGSPVASQHGHRIRYELLDPERDQAGALHRQQALAAHAETGREQPSRSRKPANDG